MKVDAERCTGCGECAISCPLGLVKVKKRKALIGEGCTMCGACNRVCPTGALLFPDTIPPDALKCGSCPVGCTIKEGYLGACQRYRNEGGVLKRTVPLHSFEEVARTVGVDAADEIRKPIITGIGAGTTYPDCRPAPYIVNWKSKGVDVVTVVTEAPLSYSSILVKVDTDKPVGAEGAEVSVGRKKVGHVTTEQYGSKMLSIGGVNLLTGKDGLLVAKTIRDLANRKPVRLKVQGGARLEIQVGFPPVVDGVEAKRMRVGCGSAAMGLFASIFRQVADEVIVLDSHLTSLMSEHPAGKFVGARPTGVRLKFRQSTPGRYFGDHGHGWGGTSILDPREAIAGVDMGVAWPGMRILVTETTGERASMLIVDEKGDLKETPLSEEAKKVVETIASSCEPSRVSAVYVGGAGGSARAGVVRYPLKLTKAVHSGLATLTVAGAPVYILPGGGINFMVDVERVKEDSFSMTPTPAIICPIEYTMKLEDYEKMGGHMEVMKPYKPKVPLGE